MRAPPPPPAHANAQTTPVPPPPPGERVARTTVVKSICDYIRIHKLQDPSDRRNIVCDAKLSSLLGEKRVTYFTLNRYLSKHFARSKKQAAKSGRKTPSSKSRASRSEPKGGNGFNAPLLLSADLSDIFGGRKYLSRPQVRAGAVLVPPSSPLPVPDDTSVSLSLNGALSSHSHFWLAFSLHFLGLACSRRDVRWDAGREASY